MRRVMFALTPFLFVFLMAAQPASPTAAPAAPQPAATAVVPAPVATPPAASTTAEHQPEATTAEVVGAAANVMDKAKDYLESGKDTGTPRALVLFLLIAAALKLLLAVLKRTGKFWEWGQRQVGPSTPDCGVGRWNLPVRNLGPRYSLVGCYCHGYGWPGCNPLDRVPEDVSLPGFWQESQEIR